MERSRPTWQVDVPFSREQIPSSAQRLALVRTETITQLVNWVAPVSIGANAYWTETGAEPTGSALRSRRLLRL